MHLEARFIPTPNETVVVAEVSRDVARDAAESARLRRSLSQLLGDLPVVLRCRQENVYAIDGDNALVRYAFDPQLESLPAVGIVLGPLLREAA